ncbi:hypothetical protein BTO01_22590 [Vibrio jasicida]|nr:hypothetical protein BTO01_22590 [Vibrio jasicida]|tara:strand:+ start:230 stop:418 length:189 start_codon:yes stop_codon:yes gene_type:complete
MFTVYQPPIQNNLYVILSLDLLANIEHNKQAQAMLIITTKEEVMAASQDWSIGSDVLPSFHP